MHPTAIDILNTEVNCTFDQKGPPMWSNLWSQAEILEAKGEIRQIADGRGAGWQ